jgi:thioredoxin-related protein
MKTLLTLLVAFALSPFASAAREGWTENFAAAKVQAKKQNKKILLDFTGSDWCPWCKRLENETFSKPEFKEYAAKNLVLVEVDFPNAGRQSAATKKQNLELKAKYGQEAFPTLIVLSPTGAKVAQFGFVEGGPKGMIKAIERTKK